MNAELVLQAQALNGEGPCWDERTRRLFWVDIREPALHAFDPETREDIAWEMPAWIGCFALTDRGAVVALRTGLYDFDLAKGALALMAAAPFDARRFLLNDGRCDRQGRFFVGPMYLPLRPGDESQESKSAPLWRYDGGDWTAVTPPVSVSNGLAWSPDGRTLYHSDTKQKTIWAYDFDVATGEPSRRREFARVEAKDGGPDGAAVDRDGFYWCAVFGDGCLLRFDPGGRLERRVELPVQYPTMPAFGGADLTSLFVTSAAYRIPPSERAGRPAEGGLFRLDAPAPGLPSSRFAA